MSAASPFPTPSVPVQRHTRHEDGDGNLHYEDCPDGSPDPVLWVCDEGHWLAWEVPPGVGDRCPIVWHDATADGRCVGTLRRPECVCKEGRALL